ncbi:PIN domain-containing protein [Aureimonas ureilytica]|uniref:PIN domain-containing protein n=1 Tax=Aureimonas ureilytica TaxID=401562 RepID=UPI0003633900|nr:hypothetical protein [Aureimonas ureilytica]
MPYVLHHSALITLLFSQKGADEIEKRLGGAKLSVLTYADVLAYLADRGLDTDEAIKDLSDLDVTLADMDQACAEEAARLYRPTQAADLSLSDRACLALARMLERPVLTTNASWAELPETVGVTIKVVG